MTERDGASPHTPGPWRSRAMGGHSVVIATAPPAHNRRAPVPYGYKEGNGYSIGLPFSYQERDGRWETRGDFVEFSHADARLISAAPEMLGLLKMILHGIERGKIEDSNLIKRNEEEIEVDTLSNRLRAAIAKATGGKT